MPSIKRVVSRTSTSGAPAWPCSRPATPTISTSRRSTARSSSPTTRTICYADGSCEDANPEGYIQACRDLPQVAMTPAQFNWNINVEGGNPFVGSGELDGNGIPPDFFQDMHVRKAFNYCFDFEAMIAGCAERRGRPGPGPDHRRHDGLSRGRGPALLLRPGQVRGRVQAGMGRCRCGTNGFYMQLAYNTGNDTRRLASEILKAGIEAVNPNFNVSVVGMPWPVLLNSRRAQKLPIYVGGWLEDFHDPHNWVHPFLHSQGAYGRVINMPEDMAAEFDALIEEAASLTDGRGAPPDLRGDPAQGAGRRRRHLDVPGGRPLPPAAVDQGLLLQPGLLVRRPTPTSMPCRKKHPRGGGAPLRSS